MSAKVELKIDTDELVRVYKEKIDNIYANKIVLDKEEYYLLLNRDAKLGYLEAHGVDNWCGYSDAVQEYRREYLEEEDE